MEIPEKDYDEFEGRLKKLSYATDYIPSSEDLVCVIIQPTQLDQRQDL